ncbi:hypothetical protein D9M68_644710 [compost metagenome]
MLLFALFIIGSGHLIQFIKPSLEFGDFNPNTIIIKFFGKLFLSSIGIISIQFLMNLIWTDFLKPFGIGFLLTIMGIITANVKWKYVDYLPYAFPNLTVNRIMETKGELSKMIVFDQGIYNSLICGAVFFIVGYFIVARKTIN